MDNSLARWNLYWVSSDGFEDCFVVAKNMRSARSVEYHMNGFDFARIKATKILRVPEAVVRSYQQQREYKKHPWPWYVYGKKFFQGIGAEFRTIDGRREMLIDDVVYDVDDYAPCHMYKLRTIGFRSIKEFNSIPEIEEDIHKYEDEDIWLEPEIHIVTTLGMFLIRCQQIEYYIANSFLLGVSKKQKAKYRTIKDLTDGWKRKTLGGMLRCIQEAWEIDPTLQAGLNLFNPWHNDTQAV